MPWYALPFGDKAKNALSKKYEVSGKFLNVVNYLLFLIIGIPTLIILEGETGKVITENGRAAVSMDPDGKVCRIQYNALSLRVIFIYLFIIGISVA